MIAWRVLVAVVLPVAWCAGRAAGQPEYRLHAGEGWQRVSAPEPGTDEWEIAEARRLIAEGQPRRARAILDTFIKKHDNADHPLLPQAHLLRGDAVSVGGDEYKALRSYEAVISRFPESPEYITALERELEIGVRYVNGMRFKWLGLRMFDGTPVGEKLLLRIHERLPGSQLGESAVIQLADAYYRKNDMRLAAEAYEGFLRSYPNSPQRMRAMKQQVHATHAQYKGPNYNAAPLLETKVLVRRFAALYPAEAEASDMEFAQVTRLDESAAAGQLSTARWYLRRGDAVSARYTLVRLVETYPATYAATQAVNALVERGWLPEPRREPLGMGR